ncbi:hypothetical protein [Paenibacillus odorifer]|nr:hypothetical protein [Paenibacillus odorifer]
MKNVMKKIGNKLVKVVVYVCAGYLISTFVFAVCDVIKGIYHICVGG